MAAFSVLALLLGQLPTAGGISVHGRLSGQEPAQTLRINLHGTVHVGLSRQDGSFVIHNVPPGVYTLEVIDPVNLWPMLEVDVGMRQPGVVQVFSPRKELLAYPVTIESTGKAQYFEVREGFNPRSLLMNPMVLMMLFSVFSMVILPKMMAGLDPETLKEMQDTQKQLLGGSLGSLAAAGVPGAVEDKRGKKAAAAVAK